MQHIVKQPDGRFAIWDAVNRDFVKVNETRDNIIEFFRDQATKEADQAIKERVAYAELIINAIEDGKDMLCDYMSCMRMRDDSQGGEHD